MSAADEPAPPPSPAPASPAAPAAPTTVISAQERRALAERYMPYVRNIAGKVKRSVAQEIDYNDLVEYGMIGLLEAAERFDPKLGANFMTFAYYRIRGAIYDGLRGMGWMRRSDYARARFASRGNELLAQVAERQQGRGEAGAGIDHAVGDLTDAVQGLAAVYITTMDAADGAHLADAQHVPADQSLGLEQSRHVVREALKRLAPQERELLELYYYRDMSLQQVGDALGLSKSWTSRLHGRVIDKLQRLLQQRL